jgi:uncharacterized protein with GYD domain
MVEVVSNVRAGPKSRRQWLDIVAKRCPEVTFLTHYALFGNWDFMDIYEAPDEETAAKVSMICSSNTDFMVESWTAIPEERLEAIAAELQEPVD